MGAGRGQGAETLKLTLATACSGIGAPEVAAQQLGWATAWCAETAAFPSMVLAERHPSSVNLGDLEALSRGETPIPAGRIDVLAAGTPCQAFSIAGLRQGMADPRGNLALAFLGLVGRVRPTWVLWENVPGVLSSDNGEAFRTILDGFEELGYVLDVEILDAQYFGVPQRRRRVFVCGQRADCLIRQRTDSSALTIAQCLSEILHAILIASRNRFESVPPKSVPPSLSRDGVLRRMKLFGWLGDTNGWPLSLDALVDARRRSRKERGTSDSDLGARGASLGVVGQSTASEMAFVSSLTDESLRNALDAAFEAMKSFITSTGTRPTTPQTIYTCSQAVLHIASLILPLEPSSPPFWSAASSSLTALSAFIDYARSTSSDLFGDVARLHAWHHFIGEAEDVLDALVDLGIDGIGTVLPQSDGMRGDPPSVREAGARVAGALTRGASSGGGWRAGADEAAAGQSVARPLTTKGGGRQDYESENFVANALKTRPGRTWEPSAERKQNGMGIGEAGAPMFTLDSRSDHAVAFDLAQVTSGENRSNPQPGGPAPTANSTSAGRIAVAFSNTAGDTALGMSLPGVPPVTTRNGDPGNVLLPTGGVRRLTPTECERLQSFVDGYTAIPVARVSRKRLLSQRASESYVERGGEVWRMASDAARYQALGNSMAVCVIRWIFERLEIADEAIRDRDRKT
jgi:site-specific DNA-cytosine methylase